MSFIDKSWMKIVNRLDPTYEAGVDEFLDFAFKHATSNNRTRCPCRNCKNGHFKTREEIKEDLIVDGIFPSYSFWSFHGEVEETIMENYSIQADLNVDFDEMDELIADTYPGFNPQSVRGETIDAMDDDGVIEADAERIYRVLDNAKTSLYPGCKVSILAFVLKLLHVKCIGGMSNKAFTMLLEELKNVLPEGEKLPKSYYKAKKIIQDLGHSYEKIDACVNDCVLFRKELVHAKFYPTCGECRWKSKDDGGDVDDDFPTSQTKQIPRKVLRYFPLKPRLKKLFMSSKTAADMRWHHDKRVKDGILRHPADFEAWHHLDSMHPTFSQEPRNVRLGLASDGFNPFSAMSLSYSIWPVVVFPYNLPPWICMKPSNMILSLIIPGERAPGNDIDVYLQPLIEELNELWNEGVETYDSSTKLNFQMRAALLWTISDFPGYANLSGWSAKGFLACPNCNEDTSSRGLQNGRKQCYMSHRRFLPTEHRWRNNRNKFDGQKEQRPPPTLLSGDAVLARVDSISHPNFGKGKNKLVCDRNHNWKKKSIFFELPYWKTLLIRHNLDVMHIEKNICDNVIGTLLGTDGKTKDNLNSRLYLQQMNIREDLHPIQRDDNTYMIPPARYTLSSAEKTKFLQLLKDIKVPDGFSSNISRCVNIKEKKLVGMKSHDCHVLLQRFLPLAIRGLLEDDVCDGLIGISLFFLQLCSKALSVEDLERLDKECAMTLCRLEMLFPPSFFDIMVHLSIHLAGEAKVAGPVQYRWMYFVERYLHTLKSYVRNKSRPEGSIAEGYIFDECLRFCSRYFKDIETTFNRQPRNFEHNDDSDQPQDLLPIFFQKGRALGKCTVKQLSDQEWMQAHLYVLQNCDEVQSYIAEHKEIIRKSYSRNIDVLHRQKFPKWFEERVLEDRKTTSNELLEQLFQLSNGHDQFVSSWKGYIVNGFRFHTTERKIQLKSQNNGVVVNGENGVDNLNYYGVLVDVIELKYFGNKRVVLFKCDWRDVHSPDRGIDVDKYGFVTVNSQRSLGTNEPFVLAFQCEQVFYVTDNLRPDWHVVVKAQRRDFYNVPDLDDAAIDEDEASKIEATTGTSIPLGSIDDDSIVGRSSRSDLPMETIVVAQKSATRKRKKC